MNAFNTIMAVDPGSIFAVWSVFRVRISVLQTVQRGEPIHAMCDRGYMEITCNVGGIWYRHDVLA